MEYKLTIQEVTKEFEMQHKSKFDGLLRVYEW